MSLPPVAALEIGTSKVRALVGEAREDGQIMITGLGEVPSRGIRKAEVIDLEMALASVKSALRAAEESSQVNIAEVHLVVSGGHIQGLINRGSVPIPQPDREITAEDMEHALEIARACSLSNERATMHTITQRYLIDEHHSVLNPQGMEGAKLSVDMLILHGLRGRLRNTVKVVRSVPLEVQDVAFGGLCSALAVLSPTMKERGVLVIDLGGGTTDYLVYAQNCIAWAGSLALGGDHVTNDIATGLGLTTSQAEQAKELYGSAQADFSLRGQKVAVPSDVAGGDRFVSLHDLRTIAHLRMEETLSMIRDELVHQDLLHHLGAGVVLCGGGARLADMDKLAGRLFETVCRIGKPRLFSGSAAVLAGPEYAATAGMVRYAISAMQRSAQTPGSLRNILRTIFGGR